MTQLAHKLVAKVAKECAMEYYEMAARNNGFYRAWPNQKAFAGHNWRYFIKFARSALTQLLAKPNFPEDKKEEIFEALMLDRSIPRGGSSIEAVPSALIH